MIGKVEAAPAVTNGMIANWLKNSGTPPFRFLTSYCL